MPHMGKTEIEASTSLLGLVWVGVLCKHMWDEDGIARSLKALGGLEHGFHLEPRCKVLSFIGVRHKFKDDA